MKTNECYDPLCEKHKATALELGDAREQLAAAVEVLKEIREAGYTLTRQDGTNVIDAVLDKIGQQ